MHSYDELTTSERLNPSLCSLTDATSHSQLRIGLRAKTGQIFFDESVLLTRSNGSIASM